jgi:hypothetical protein
MRITTTRLKNSTQHANSVPDAPVDQADWDLSSVAIYRHLATAIISANTRKKQPMSRGTHQSEESSTSRLGCAVFAQPITPWGYSIDQAPTTIREINPIGPPYLSGAISSATNVAATSARTTQSEAFMCAVLGRFRSESHEEVHAELSTECDAGDVHEQSRTQNSNATHNHADSGRRHFVGVPTTLPPCIGEVVHSGSQCLRPHDCK